MARRRQARRTQSVYNHPVLTRLTTEEYDWLCAGAAANEWSISRYLAHIVAEAKAAEFAWLAEVRAADASWSLTR